MVRKFPPFRSERKKRSTSEGTPQFPNGISGKLPYHLSSNRNFRIFWPNGKHPGYQKSESCLKQGGKISDFCLKQGEGMRGRAAPPTEEYIKYPPGGRINEMLSEAEKETADQQLRLDSVIDITEVGLKLSYCAQPRVS